MISLGVGPDDGQAGALDAGGAGYETHAEACRIGLATFYRWMDDGEKDPSGVYGRFRQRMIRAVAEGEKTLHNMAAKTENQSLGHASPSIRLENLSQSLIGHTKPR
jgi:hypothetical protein